MAKQQKPLSPAIRALLVSWPAGERRDLVVKWGAASGVNARDFDNAKARGLLAFAGELHKRTWVQTAAPVAITRTEKPCKPYKPRGPDRRYAERNPFPWGIDEHWQRIRQSKARKVPDVARQLGVADSVLRYQYPKLVRTKAQLRDLRTALVAEFLGEQPGRRRPYYSAGVLRQAVTGEQLHMLFMEMLIAPKYEGSRCTRFVAVDPEQAFKEREQLTGNTTSIRARYERWLALNPEGACQAA